MQVAGFVHRTTVRRPGDVESTRQGPTFTLLDQNGSKVKLSEFKGRKVLVYFYPAG
jgi:peroxiredoxin